MSSNITPSLLETKDVDTGQRGRFYDGCDALMKGLSLYNHIFRCWNHNLILDKSNSSNPWGSSRFFFGFKGVAGKIEIIGLG